MNLYFTYKSRNTLKSFTLFITVKAIAKLNLGHRNKFEIEFYKISCHSSRSSGQVQTPYFTWAESNANENKGFYSFAFDSAHVKYGVWTWPQTTQNWSFHVVVLQRTTKKCTKSYNARAQPLFCSLNLSFSDVPVAVAVVVILNSLLAD